MTIPIVITADEVNCLIYAYLQDSGFTHSAFTFRMEARLEHSPNLSKHVPRGQLIEIFSKALLYMEVESHWRGDVMATNCKRPFSLLETHECSSDATPRKPKLPRPSPEVVLQQLTKDKPLKSNGTTNDGNKRKAGVPSSTGQPAEKRPRKSSREMSVDDSTGLAGDLELKSKEEIPLALVQIDACAKSSSGDNAKKDKSRRQRGPLGATDPNAICILKAHKSEVFPCAWNRFASLLASGSKDGKVNIWSIPPTPNDGSPLLVPPPVEVAYASNEEQVDLTSLDWNPDGTLLAIGSYDSVLRVADANGKLYFSHPQHMGSIFATRFSKSGRWLLTASLDGTACVWDMSDKRLHMQYRCHEECCLDVIWLDDSYFVSCGADGRIHIMHVSEAKPIKTFIGHEHEVNSIRLNRDRTRLASCSDDCTSRIWTIGDVTKASSATPSSEQVVILAGHKGQINTVCWGPLDSNNHEIVATCSFDGTSRLWDSLSGQCLRIFADSKKPLYSLVFSPEQRWLVTGGGDGWVHVYDVKAQKRRWSWYSGGEKPGVFDIAWQQFMDRNRLAIALECSEVVIVDVTRVDALSTV